VPKDTWGAFERTGHARDPLHGPDRLRQPADRARPDAGEARPTSYESPRTSRRRRLLGAGRGYSPTTACSTRA
jgi:hypothetical protein